MFRDFIKTLPKNIFSCFKGYYFVWHIVAIILTYIFIITDIDWKYFLFFRSDTLFNYFIPALGLGGLLPFFIPIFLILNGYFTNNKKKEILGWALGQAAIIGSIISSFYKAFTGRIQPDMHDLATNISHNFQFGFLKNGIFWGWPSSHTTVAFAMAFVLIGLFPQNKVIKIFAALYALYIGFGVSISIHWLSDFVAGAIIGIIIGLIVSKNYVNKFQGGTLKFN